MANNFFMTEGNKHENLQVPILPETEDNVEPYGKVQSDGSTAGGHLRSTEQKLTVFDQSDAETQPKAMEGEGETVSSTGPSSLLQIPADIESCAYMGGSGGGGGGMNFFSNPEIKMKLKKADGIPTLTAFLEEVCKPLDGFWKEFGMAVGIEEDLLDSIERKNSTRDSSESLCFAFAEVFTEWEKKRGDGYKPCTWTSIHSILKHSLKCKDVADRIEKKFLNHERESTEPSDGSGYSSLPSQPPCGQSPPNSFSNALFAQQEPNRPLLHFGSRDNVFPSPEFPFVGAGTSFGSIVPLTIGNTPFGGTLSDTLTTTSDVTSDAQVPRGGGMYYSSFYGDETKQQRDLSALQSMPGVTLASYHPGMISSYHADFPFPHGYASDAFYHTQVSSNPSVFKSNISGISSGSITGDTHAKQISSPRPRVSEESSENSYHSATDSIKKSDDVSFTELFQRYVKEIEHGDKYRVLVQERNAPQPSKNMKTRKLEVQEKESLTQKELNKAHERISSLEVRVHDLQMQSTIEVPDDHEIGYMQREKLEQEYRRMRELKRQAEKQSIDAKQTAQRLVAETSRLREELALVKNDREMIVNKLKREAKQVKVKTSLQEEQVEVPTEELKQKIAERYKQLASMNTCLSRKDHLIKVSELKPLYITPHCLYEIFLSQKADVSLGHVVIAGLPACGKTTVLKSLLEKENPGKLVKPLGEETFLQIYELLVAINPFTDDSKWTLAPGLESAVYVLSVIVSQYCFQKKHLPQFQVSEDLEQEVKSIAFLQDEEVQQHFIRVYIAIKDLIENKVKADQLLELAVHHPSFINLWDVGVNRVLYDNVISVASQSERLVMVICLDLERDVPNLHNPPDMSRKKSYSQRFDSKLGMRFKSRLHYLLVLAGIKRLFNHQSPNPKAPEAMFVGLYTKEFGSVNGGKKLKETVSLLQRSLLAESEKLNITNIIDPKIITFCTDPICQAKELDRLKKSIEALVHAQSYSTTVFSANSLFLRSFLYGEDKPTLIKRTAVTKLAKKCGIYSHVELESFLVNCRDTGSLLFHPRSSNHFLYDHIALNVVKPLLLLDRLYYLLSYTGTDKGIGTLTMEELEQYQYGVVSKQVALKVFKGSDDVELFMSYLSNSQVCVNVAITGHDEKYFFPSLRTQFDDSTPSKNSLFIKCSSQFLHSSCLVLYVKFLGEFFNVPSEALVSHTKHYNSVLFKVYMNASTSTDILILYNLKNSFFEVRIGELQENLHFNMCSRLVYLSHRVFQYLSEHLQNQTFNLCIKCPENDTHLACFFLNYHQKEVYCKGCRRLVQVTDSRLCWLS